MSDKEAIITWLRSEQAWQDVVNLTLAMSNEDTKSALHKVADMIENGYYKDALDKLETAA